MSHELLLKLVLTTLSVWLVLELARRSGARVAGLAAGLPISTAPGLVLLGLAHGDGFAAAAGVGSLLATAICAAFAWAYASMRRRGPLRALLGGSSAAGVAAVVAAWLAAPPRAGAGLAFATASAISLLVASRLRPEGGTDAVKPRMPRARRAALSLMIGVVNTTVCALSNGLPAIVCGLLCGLPVVCALLAVQQHRHGGSESAIHVLRGYVDGLFSRGVFTFTFILSAESAGWPLGLALGGIAWALALPCRIVGWRILASAIAYFSTKARSIT